jgi:hypothetical protein
MRVFPYCRVGKQGAKMLQGRTVRGRRGPAECPEQFQAKTNDGFIVVCCVGARVDRPNHIQFVEDR